MTSLNHSIVKMVGCVALGVSIAAVPAIAQSVNVDYRNPAELVGYRTYSIQKLHATDVLVEPRLLAAIERDLDRKGWHEVPHNGNVVVTAVLASNDDQQEYANFYEKLSNLQWNVAAPGEDPESVAQSPGGTLVVDMYDTHNNKLIWRSTATDFLTNSTPKNELKVDNVVNRMFDRLPWNDTPFGVPDQNPSRPNETNTPAGCLPRAR